MTKPVITCISDNSDNLNCLISELHKYFGSVVLQTIFHKESSLPDSIKNRDFPDHKTQLFVIDINNSNGETIGFINNISQLFPSAIKLIVAEKNHVAQIQQFSENNDSILFLTRPWDSSQMNIALNMALQTYSKLCISSKPNINELTFDEQVEEKVNQRLHKLIDANTAKDSFLSIIAHDLKSPFVALKGISEILLNDWETLSEKTKLELVGDLYKTSNDTHKLLETLVV